MVTKYFIDTLQSDRKFSSSIEILENGKVFKLKYTCGQEEIIVGDNNPFHALVKLRLQLESLGLILACNGSRIDVYPSGMSLMGVMAYELEFKRPGIKLLNIFESTDQISKLASVAEQKSYRDSWIKSLQANEHREEEND